jgi:uncharacterized protein DUF1329
MLALVVAALLLSAGTTAAGTVDGREWPPPADRYAAPGTPVAPGLAVGDTLGASNASAARDLLPPEILKHYESNGYRNEIASWPEGIHHWERSFEDATRGNTGRYGIDPETGTIVEQGKPAKDVYGIPFPTLDAADPEAGLKAVWNMFYNYWNVGSYHYQALIVWVSPRSGAERVSNQDVYFQYYENQSPAYRVPDPQDFSWQSLAVALTPADLQGTAALTYRYRDAKKRDSVWTYVPALRRVRAVSPANRSDGFLGSDLSQDDGHFFDAKPEDFTWRTIGLREALRIADKWSVRGEGGPAVWVGGPAGGWRDAWTRNAPAAGYQVSSWKGLGWAPVSGVLTKRRFWVVEAVPRDRYYLYGRLELWIDAETWIGAWNRKFGWKGEPLNTYQVAGYLNHPVKRDGVDYTEWLWSSQEAWQCAESIKLDRATLAGLRRDKDAPFDRRVVHPVGQLFDMQALNRFGK